MLKHRMTVMLSILVLLSMVLSACTVAAPSAAPDPAPRMSESRSVEQPERNGTNKNPTSRILDIKFSLEKVLK